MIGKILGGFLGAKAAENSSIGGTGGALMGAAASTVVRRLSLPVLVALGAGGYIYKKWSDKNEAEAAKRKSFETPPKPAKRPKPSAT